MDQVIAQMAAWNVSLALALAMGLAWRGGIWLGNRMRGLQNGREPSKSSTMPASRFWAFCWAFTFGISISKHDQRRTLAVVADSNAIGDFYTCANLLKDPAKTQLQSLIRQYAELRVRLAQSRIDDAQLDVALVEFQHMQDQMTQMVAQALLDGTPIAVSLTNALNAVTSNHAARLAAIRDRLPVSIVGLLFISSIITTMLIGVASKDIRNQLKWWGLFVSFCWYARRSTSLST